MLNTRAIRRRIRSVRNTAQITKAMQMVASSKMRKAQQAALSSRHYASLLQHLLTTLGDRATPETHPLLRTSNSGPPLVLLLSTDKGLCGPLNSNLFREVLQLDSSTHFVASGRKGVQFLARIGRKLLADFSFPDSPSFLQIKAMSNYCIERFIEGEVSTLSVLYPQFISTLQQKPTLTPLLPIKPQTIADGIAPSAEPAAPSLDYLIEPSPQTLLDNLLPYYIHFQIYQMLLSTRASEHSARMVAMKNATDNAKQLIKDLTLEYNKQRQSSITNELLDISTAQRALE